MQFICNTCKRRMKSDEATGEGDGWMGISSFCPNCGSRFKLLSNPGETLLLKALNAGGAGQELMGNVLQSAQNTLPNAVDQETMPSLARKTDWEKLAGQWVWVEPGSFLMGSPDSEPGREPDESPQHKVVISKGFYMGKFPLTIGQWEEIMGVRDEKYLSKNTLSKTSPAVFISWNDLQEFLYRINQVDERINYRLPSEAEWEYSCRAGTDTMWSFGEDRHALGDYAWYIDSESDAENQHAWEVGLKKPNAWGLHDMHGNIWEWCNDVYDHDYYSKSPVKDPLGPKSDSLLPRIARGGYFRYFTRHSRSASRNARNPGERHRVIGARLIKELK